MNVQTTKKCPFCAEDVNIEAIKCKHCGSMLNNPQDKQNEGKKRIIKTLTFEVTTNGQREMAKKISIMEKDGWKETNRVTETGKYRGGKGCCLFFIFAPLALLAGHNKDKVIITFEKYISEEEMQKEKTASKEKQKDISKIVYWAILILLTFWIWYLTIPLIAIWYIWKKTNLEKKKKWTTTGLILFLLFCFGIYKIYSVSGEPLTFTEPQNNSTIQGQNTVIIKGSTNPKFKNISLTVNEVPVVIKNGEFSYVAKLDKEKNDFKFTSKWSGMISEKIFTVNRIFTDEEKALIEKQKVEQEQKKEAALKARQEAAQKAEEERKAKELAEQKAWEQSKAGQICIKHPEWTKDDCINLADNKIWIGMSYDMLVFKRGKPNSANPSNYGSGTNWQWCWYDYTPSCFYGSDDGIVDSYN